MEIKKRKSILGEWKELSIYSRILLVFILLNPVIDVLTSVGKRELGLSISVGIISKGIFLAFILISFILTKSTSKFRKYAKIILFIFIGYAIIHVGNAYVNFGLIKTITVITTLIKTFYLPMVLLSLESFIQKDEVHIILRYLAYVAIFIIGIIAISLLTGTSYNAYQYNKLGTVGWFYAANEISALLGIFTPVLIYYLLDKDKISIVFKSLFMAIYIFLYYQIGTKVVAMSVIITATFMLMLLVGRKIKTRKLKIGKQMTSMSIILVLSIGLIPITPIGYNLNVHNSIVNSKLDMFKDENLEMENKEKYDSIQEIKRDFLDSNITETEYRIISLIFSSRDQYFAVRKYIYDQSDVMMKLFGQTQFATTKQGEIKSYIVEIDFIDIYFNNGLIGSLIYWVIVMGVIGSALIATIRKKNIFIVGSRIPFYLCAILLGFGIAMFAGHVFVSPAVSFYLAVLILLFYVDATKSNNVKSTEVGR